MKYFVFAAFENYKKPRVTFIFQDSSNKWLLDTWVTESPASSFGISIFFTLFKGNYSDAATE